MVSMIMVSGLRAGLVIGLIVTPPKIQQDGSRWNRKFGSGGGSSSMRPGRCTMTLRSFPTSESKLFSSALEAVRPCAGGIAG